MSEAATTEPTAPATETTSTETEETPRTFNEEQVNKIVQERLARDRRERPSDEEIASLREKATKFDEVEQANASDLEKAQKRAEEAEAAAAKATTTAQTALRRAAVVAAATKAGADPDIVHALLADKGFKHGETEIVVGDDGQVAGVDEAVKALVEEKELGGAAPPPPADAGAREPVQPKDLDDQIREAEKKGDWATATVLNNRKLLAIREKQAS